MGAIAVNNAAQSFVPLAALTDWVSPIGASECGERGRLLDPVGCKELQRIQRLGADEERGEVERREGSATWIRASDTGNHGGGHSHWRAEG